MAAPARAPRPVRLLLDEMHSPAIAAALALDGFDVVAVAARVELKGTPDDELLAKAAEEGRAIVTENVGDFSRLASMWAAEGREHGGVIFTNPRRYDRAATACPGDVIAALRSLLATPLRWGPSMVWWL
jgi:NAD(P)-dependent dehydrogenase (short-subunit alcohol dehydrogenase family)